MGMDSCNMPTKLHTLTDNYCDSKYAYRQNHKIPDKWVWLTKKLACTRLDCDACKNKELV